MPQVAVVAQRAGHAVDVGVVGPPAVVGAHQGVGRADEFGAFGALVGELQGGELAGHRHRYSDPLGPETADQCGQLLRRALDALVGPVGQAQRAVGRQVQQR